MESKKLGEKKSLTLPMIALKITTYCGPLAQLVEHLTFNQGVAGSNPAGPAFFNPYVL